MQSSPRRLSILLLSFLLVLGSRTNAFSVPTTTARCTTTASSSRLWANTDADERKKREAEISQKINQLKQQGRISNKPSIDDDDELDLSSNNDNNELPMTDVQKLRAQRKEIRRQASAVDQYSNALADRLGRRARYIGIDGGKTKKKQQDSDDDDDDEPLSELDDEDSNIMPASSTETTDFTIYDPDLFQEQEEDKKKKEETDDEEDEALVDLVAKKLKQKRIKEQEESDQRLELKMKQWKKDREEQKAANIPPGTSGIGGAYVKNETAAEDVRRPSRGSWGYFERPKDISKAFGGGRRVGAGYMKEESKEESYERTRLRMKEYREKMGIDVQTEKDHAKEIEEAMQIAKRAMERGVYNAAVSSLEKVTKWCSSNSPVGSEVYLELAMAYEAVGKSDMAIQVYQKLTTCRVEDVKNNAKKLLYGLESFEFMKSDAQLASFNRKKVRNTFIDTTRMDQFASNFDNVYNTAYVDTSSSKYKKLTENVVRSVREARQILLRASKGALVERTKVIQALRSVARRFDASLGKEKREMLAANEPVPMMDGKPLVVPSKESTSDVIDFTLASPEQMLENMSGEWHLSIVADKIGDGVKFLAPTPSSSDVSWQQLDTEEMRFTSEAVGLFRLSESGRLSFENDKRILRRSDISSDGLASLFGAASGGAASNRMAQQIMSVDSVLMVTRCAEVKRFQDEEKEHFAVWSRVEPGTYSEVASK